MSPDTRCLFDLAVAVARNPESRSIVLNVHPYQVREANKQTVALAEALRAMIGNVNIDYLTFEQKKVIADLALVLQNTVRDMVMPQVAKVQTFE